MTETRVPRARVTGTRFLSPSRVTMSITRSTWDYEQRATNTSRLYGGGWATPEQMGWIVYLPWRHEYVLFDHDGQEQGSDPDHQEMLRWAKRIWGNTEKQS